MGYSNEKLGRQGQGIYLVWITWHPPDLDSISYNLPFFMYSLTHQLTPFALTLHSCSQNTQDAPRRDNKLTSETDY
jgi:hypothetical protein